MTQGKQVEAVSVEQADSWQAAYARLDQHLDENYYAGARDDLRHVSAGPPSQSPLSVDEGRKAPLPEGSEELVERLRQISAKLPSEIESGDVWDAAALIESLSHQLTLARLEAFEEAAKVAEDTPLPKLATQLSEQFSANAQRKLCAKAIRALAKGG